MNVSLLRSGARQQYPNTCFIIAVNVAFLIRQWTENDDCVHHVGWNRENLRGEMNANQTIAKPLHTLHTGTSPKYLVAGLSRLLVAEDRSAKDSIE